MEPDYGTISRETTILTIASRENFGYSSINCFLFDKFSLPGIFEFYQLASRLNGTTHRRGTINLRTRESMFPEAF